jgi:hypothetical protein
MHVISSWGHYAFKLKRVETLHAKIGSQKEIVPTFTGMSIEE